MANIETIVYEGTEYFIQTNGKYYQSRKAVYGTRSLHRRIWIEQNGTIPEGYEIHHIDGDWRNNDINNLELKTRSAHMSEHFKKWYADEVYRDKVSKGLEKATLKAPEWHKSKIGREWHSIHGKQTWDNRESVLSKCVVCGGAFKAVFNRAKYCSISCKNKYFRNSSEVEMVCKYCGKKYMAKKVDSKKTKCCSRSCGAKMRWAINNTK